MGTIVGGVGVDGGGFVITPNGVVPIPPWDPAVRVRLDAVVALARLNEVDSTAEVAPVVRQLVSEVSAQLGVAGGDAHYVYYAADGYGFTTTADGDELCPILMEERLRRLLEGKGWTPTPVPEPKPHWLVEALTADMFRKVLDRGGDIGAFVEAPQEVAASLDLTVPDVALRHVTQLVG